MVHDAQCIFYEDIERFELSRHSFNLLLIENNVNRLKMNEIIGGQSDDNLDDDMPLMAQMGTGPNRFTLYSGKGNDTYSVILEDKEDIIVDRGGENVVAVMLRDSYTFSNVQLGILARLDP